MRIICTGASGLLGINFAVTAANEHDVFGIYNSNALATSLFRSASIDLFNTNDVCKLVEEFEPDWIVHCAALADVNKCEEDPSLAYRMNVQLSRQLAESAHRYNVKFLYVSTDGIFDGKREFYTETDVPAPLNSYAKTKLAGEEAVLDICSDALIARVNFYGWSLTGTRSLAEWIINNLRSGNRIKGYNDTYFTPLLVNTLANILIKMMENKLSGIYHVVCSEKLTKFDFATQLAHQFKLNENLIEPASAVEFKSNVERPLSLVLSNEKLIRHLGNIIPTLMSDIQWLQQLEQEGYANKIQAMHAKE